MSEACLKGCVITMTEARMGKARKRGSLVVVMLGVLVISLSLTGSTTQDYVALFSAATGVGGYDVLADVLQQLGDAAFRQNLVDDPSGELLAQGMSNLPDDAMVMLFNTSAAIASGAIDQEEEPILSFGAPPDGSPVAALPMTLAIMGQTGELILFVQKTVSSTQWEEVMNADSNNMVERVLLFMEAPVLKYLTETVNELSMRDRDDPERVEFVERTFSYLIDNAEDPNTDFPFRVSDSVKVEVMQVESGEVVLFAPEGGALEAPGPSYWIGRTTEDWCLYIRVLINEVNENG